MNTLRPTARERAISCKTLICFLQSLMHERVTIELKDDCRVTGRLTHVDAYMNCNLETVLIQTPVSYLSEEMVEKHVPDYFVKGTRIRYVHFEDGIEPMARMEQRLKESGREYETRIENAKNSKRPKDRYRDPRRRSPIASTPSSQTWSGKESGARPASSSSRSQFQPQS